jgi:hypothetical protein
VKRFSADQVAVLHRVSAALFDGEGDAEAYVQTNRDLHLIPATTKVDPQRFLDWVLPIWEPVAGPQPFTYTPEFAAFVIERNFDALGEWGDVVRAFTVAEASKDWTFLTRIQLGLYSVLGALRATGDWRAIHDELLDGAPPATDLGRRHAAWVAGRSEGPGS